MSLTTSIKKELRRVPAYTFSSSSSIGIVTIALKGRNIESNVMRKSE